MGKVTDDGGVISAGIPTSERGEGENNHRNKFMLKKGNIVDVVYPEDIRNTSGERIEYTVNIDGQTYPGVVAIQNAGAVFQRSERIYKKAEKSFRGKFDSSEYDENLDSEIVYCLFLEGNGDIPVIIGSAQHPRNYEYLKGAGKLPSKEDGDFVVDEFNGVEISIDKDGNYLVKNVGRKDVEGVVINESAVDSQIKFHANGDIELDTHGTGGTADLRMKLTKADKKAEIYAQENKIILDATGTLVEDKNGNKVTMDPAGIIVEDKNANKTTKNAAGIIFEDANGNKVTMSAAGIEMQDANGNKITMDATGININSSANLVKIDGSVYGLHRHVGDLGIPTSPPTDANTE